VSRVRRSTILAAAVAGALLCACGGGGQHAEKNEAAPVHRGPVRNPSDFPLYPSSVVATVVPISSKQMRVAMHASDPHADLPPDFHGNEVIAENRASLQRLSGWVRALEARPPLGLHRSVRRGRSSRDSSWSGSSNNGSLDNAIELDSADGSRSVYVIVADPREVRAALGPMFTLIENYSSVPGMLRGPMDQQAKQNFGYTVTEMLDRHSPVGAAISTVKRLQNADRRAIVVLDLSRAR
jgi:hypothetical protein